MSVNPTLRAAPMLGFYPDVPSNSVSTLGLNAAATWLAKGFVPTAATTVTEASLYCSGVTGTLGATNLSCDIYSDLNGVPNASLQTTTTVNATPTGAAWVRFSSFGSPPTLTAGLRYWAVFKNTNGTPASNFPTWQWGGSNTSSFLTGSGDTKYGWTKVHTIDSGTNWNQGASSAVCGLRIGYGNGLYEGLPVSSISTTTDKAFGSTEFGVRFVTPVNTQLVVRGLSFHVLVGSGPTGDLQMRLYTGTGASPTLQGTTSAIPRANIGGFSYYTAYFSSSITVPAGTLVRCTLKDTAADSSAAFYGMTLYTVDTDANSLAILPFADGTAGDQIQQTSLSAGTWTDTNSGLYPFALILDTSGPFASAGSVQLFYPGMTGGLNG